MRLCRDAAGYSHQHSCRNGSAFGSIAKAQKPYQNYACRAASALPRAVRRETACLSPHASQPIALGRRELLGLGSLTLLLGSQTFTPVAQAAPTTQLRSLTAEEQAAVDKALKAISKTKAPVALRLVFHDAGTYSMADRDGGINASIRFELDRPENFGLKRGWRIIEQLSESLKGTPAAALSYADLIALAGAQAVAVCAGPRVCVRVGRQDASGPDPEGRLPAETLSAQQQKDYFAGMGFTAREFMALMGSHTIGNKGFGAPDKFDNEYYASLLRRPWLNTKDEMASMIGLPSDHVLPDDTELLPIIQEYAQDQETFYNDFVRAYIKLTELGA